MIGLSLAHFHQVRRGHPVKMIFFICNQRDIFGCCHTGGSHQNQRHQHNSSSAQASSAALLEYSPLLVLLILLEVRSRLNDRKAYVPLDTTAPPSQGITPRALSGLHWPYRLQVHCETMSEVPSMMRREILLLAVSVLAIASALAQTHPPPFNQASYLTVTVTVTDENGVAVPGALVQLRS